MFAFGWIVFLEMGIITEVLLWLGLSQSNDLDNFVTMLIATVCPIGAQTCIILTTFSLPHESWGAFYIGQIIIFLLTLLVALIVLGLTLATFNRCMGRVPERAQRPRREPQMGKQVHWRKRRNHTRTIKELQPQFMNDI
jgi:hypothetical protein